MEDQVTTVKKYKSIVHRVAEIPYWYHRIELPGGTVTKGWAPIDAEKYFIPDDLDGKRVLDIGAWDGYWTWEALKRGAKEVVAIDDFSDDLGHPDMPKRDWSGFDLCREAFGFTEQEIYKDTQIPLANYLNDKGQKVARFEMSVYDIEKLGKFDVVFFFGTIYHLKYPLLAVDTIAKVNTGSIYIETASADDYSTYRGGIGKGHPDRDMIMEFHPGKQYGGNEHNWWIPTLQCLGEMLRSAGYKDVAAWPLIEEPKTLPECRGFLSATKDPAAEPANRPKCNDTAPQQATAKGATAKVTAVMSVPRLGFHDNMSCVFEALSPLGINICKVQGAFWGQCLERGLQMSVDGGADYILTIDYDTTFKKADVDTLLNLIHKHPEAAAIVPIQVSRNKNMMLMTVKGKSGRVRSDVPVSEFMEETKKIATGHFGLTVLRVSDLLDLPHPWFLAQPNSDGMWDEGRIDADIYFWKLMEKHKKTVLSANRVVVGHLELMVSWPDTDSQPLYQCPDVYHTTGKPANVWK